MTTTTSTSRRSSSNAARISIRCSDRSDGDFHPKRVAPAVLTCRRHRLVDLPWTMADQRHGVELVRTGSQRHAEEASLPVGDIVFTDQHDTVVAVWVADCAPIVLVGAERELAVLHAGWRGLAAGVVDHAVAAFTEPIVDAVLGPAIGPCCYEFGEHELAELAAGVRTHPDSIRARTSRGAPAADVPRAVAVGLEHHGIGVRRIGGCTGCEFDGYSHRVRRERERHVVAAWQSPVVTP